MTRVTLQIVASLTENSRCIIYDCNMFIVQATDAFVDSQTYKLSIFLYIVDPVRQAILLSKWIGCKYCLSMFVVELSDIGCETG
jgi:hypothetical protein